jgi:DNA invertase Pin-like site-specific DNA recombinase
MQEVGYARLRERGITLIASDSPNAFQDDTPTAKLVRQVLGAIAEFDKAMTVAKPRGARERKRKTNGKCEGRKSLAEMHPAVVREAKRLGRASPKSGVRRSLRKISAELAKLPLVCQVPRRRRERISLGMASPTAPRASGQCWHNR